MSNTKKTNNELLYEKFHKNTSFIKSSPHLKNFTYGDILVQIDKIIKDKTNLKVLDLGCGAGSIAIYLMSNQMDVIGVDISEIAIKNCIETKTFHGFMNGEFINLSVENYISINIKEKYDLIIMSELIEHLEDDEDVLIKVKKLLKKDGVIFITTPSENAPLYRLGLLKKFDKRVGHLRRYSAKLLSEKMEKLGYKILSVRKTEGLLRNAIFSINGFGIFIRVMNKFVIIGRVFSLFDFISMKIFGESDIQVVAIKK